MPRIRCPNCGLTIDLESRKEIDFTEIFNALKSKDRTFTELLHITRLPRKTLSLRLKSLSKEGLVAKDNGGYRLVGSWRTSSYRISHVGENMERLYNILRNNSLVIVLALCLFTYVTVPVMVYALGWLNEAPKEKPVIIQSPPINLSASFEILTEAQYTNYYFMGLTNEITFDASSSKGDILEYLWSFGDGATARGQLVTHKYENPSSEYGYEVMLTIVGRDGLRVGTRQKIMVLPYPNAHIYLEELQAGDTLTVTVNIADVEDLYGWNFAVKYSGLDETSIMISDFCGAIKIHKDFDKNDNLIDFVTGTLKMPEYTAGVSGSGILATITFNILEADYDVTLDNIELLNFNVHYIPYVYA